MERIELKINVLTNRSFEQPGAVLVVRVTTWFAWTLKATPTLVEMMETVSCEREFKYIKTENYYFELQWCFGSCFTVIIYLYPR